MGIDLLRTLFLKNPFRSGKQGHPDAGILDDGEVAFPIGTAHNGCVQDLASTRG